MLYIAQTGCQWRYLPESFGPWTRVWSQFRRWSRNGTWAKALTVLHAAARRQHGRAEQTPSMVVIDTHLARGASNGGFTFHDRGGPTVAPKARSESWPSTSPAYRWPRWWCPPPPTRTGQRPDVGAPDPAGHRRAARARLGGPRGHCGRRTGPQSGAGTRGAPGRMGRQAAGLPPHSARLARRGRPRPPGALAPVGEVVREHDHLGNRVAPGRLHRHDVAPPVPGASAPAPGWARGLSVRFRLSRRLPARAGDG